MHRSVAVKRLSRLCSAALILSAALPFSTPALRAQAPPSVHELAQRIDRHYNHLNSLRAAYVERYTGVGQTREERGTLLLKKPGRMRFTYADGKLFVLDGKFATTYMPGDPQAQRVPAKQLDDLRSPLRFLLGHTEIEKELDHLSATTGANGTVTLAGAPRYATGSGNGENRVQKIAVIARSSDGEIVGLRLTEIDGAVTEFRFTGSQENVPTSDADFRFAPPVGVTVVTGLPPA